MAKIDDLIRQVSDARLKREIASAVAELKKRTRFGLVYEEHLPEMAALPGMPIHEGSMVVRRDRLSVRHSFKVSAIEDGSATLQPLGGGDTQTVPLTDLIALQRFGEPVYPGLEKVGSVERGGPERPHHAVINAENYHALKTLAWTHQGKVDAIYIDPPYNTGARDWKYNNDFVESDDAYRHSKWLAMMERRLLLAKELLNPADSVLIVTIDEKEYLRLGLLLEQTFPEARIQMISSLINPASMPRQSMFGRSDEYVFFVFFGDAAPVRMALDGEWVSSKGRTFTGEIRWDLVMQSGPGSQREDSPAGFYPVYIDPDGPKIAAIGDALPLGASHKEKETPEGLIALWPIRKNGSDGRWRLGSNTLRERLSLGYVRVGGNVDKGFTLYYLPPAEVKKLTDGTYEVFGYRDDGSPITSKSEVRPSSVPTTQWRISSHDATQYGSRLLANVMPDRKFPFPKSLYAVEDALRFFVANKPAAIILDFFAGSGTTAHAVMRLNKQDGGRRQCISITNNEVGADEQKALREKGLLPGDAEWERWGIFDYITRPRIEAAITGKTPDGKPIAGDYKFTDEFPMADGFEENVTFFNLNYLDPDRVDLHQQFDAVVPLLWLSAGGIGAWEDDAAADGQGYSMPAGSRYAVLFKESCFKPFLAALETRPDVTHVFLATDSDEAYAEMRAVLPIRITTRMLYRDYLRTFKVGGSATIGGGR